MNAKATMQELILPFKILISPLKTFSQLSQEPTAKGLVSLVASILVAAGIMQYISASKIFLNINGQTNLVTTPFFGDWFTTAFASTVINILFYWFVFTSGLAFISRTFRGKEVSWRVLFVVLGYILSVFLVLYVVRAVMYFALPSVYFEELSYWPPKTQEEFTLVATRLSESWGPNYAYLIGGTLFTLVVSVWLVLLGAIALRALREITWPKASVISIVVFFFVFFLFQGLP